MHSSGDAQSGDADQGMSIASAKPSGGANVEPTLASGRGQRHGTRLQSAPGPNLTPAQIREYLFAEGLTAEDMRETEELFDTLKIAHLAKYFEVSVERRIEPLAHTLAAAQKAKIKADKAKLTGHGVSQARSKGAPRLAATDIGTSDEHA